MKGTKYIEADVLIKKAIEVLFKEVGPVETNRFVNMPREKRMESVRRHREWQKRLKKDAFFDAVFKD